MISFPNSKINLGLNIISKRPDGYHNLESCIYPIQWEDMLEIMPADKTQFTCSGGIVPGSEHDNLCLKAYRMLQQEYDLPPVQMHLHKIIPIGAGLGGGSADASYTLLILNDIFQLKIQRSILEEMASIIGSDCPFFISNKPVYATGTGTTLSEINIDLSGMHIVVVKPDASISTADAYSGIIPKVQKEGIREIIESVHFTEWKYYLNNDFEDGIFQKYPEIKLIKEQLYELGATYASMSGSGSAVYGLFKDKPDVLRFRRYQHFTGLL
jgi:4-diphosphocytidyl-2-C-methyl-D-erythritol kinase